MNIIIAPDSFKGSLTAKEATKAISIGARAAISTAVIEEIPIADGGEGTLESLVYSTQGYFIKVTTLDPLGRKINARYGVLGNSDTAIIEMSSASGLTLLRESELNPLYTSTYGTGLIIQQALNDGFRDFIICIGGSSTNDCGTGMAQALGIKFYDENMNEILEYMSGNLLDMVTTIDTHNLHPAIKESNFLVASDVTNPLLGINGCAQIYAPQKGATLEIVAMLETKMLSFINVAELHYKKFVRNNPGTGAAGGMGAGLILFMQATLKSGIDIVLDACDFSKRISNADLIITGEGEINNQTMSGKTIIGVINSAKNLNIPIIAFAGTINDFEDPKELGLAGYYSICSDNISKVESVNNAFNLLSKKVEEVLKNYYNNI